MYKLHHNIQIHFTFYLCYLSSPHFGETWTFCLPKFPPAVVEVNKQGLSMLQADIRGSSSAKLFLTSTGSWQSWKMYSQHLLRDHRDSFEAAVYPEINIGGLNSGCNEPVKRKDAANHSDVCPKEVTPCNQFHKDM